MAASITGPRKWNSLKMCITLWSNVFRNERIFDKSPAFHYHVDLSSFNLCTLEEKKKGARRNKYFKSWPYHRSRGVDGDTDGKESACQHRDRGLIPGSGRGPGKGNGNPLQYSCLRNSMDRGDWQATVHGVAKSRKQQSDYHLHFHCHQSCF